MAGPISVILHGERDCGNSFVHHRMPAPHRFFTTAITEEEATSGRVDAPLAECLRLVLEETNPSAVLVLHTCLLSMIGSEPQKVIEEVVRDTGSSVPVLFLDTGGLRLSGQAQMADWLYATLASLPQLPLAEEGWRERWLPLLVEEAHLLDRSIREEGAGLDEGCCSPAPLKDRSLEPEAFLERLRDSLSGARRPGDRISNLIGVESGGLIRSEALRVLFEAGVVVAGIFPEGAHLRQWRRISHARLNVVVDRGLYPRLLERLERGYGMETLEVPLPIGLSQTERFYALVGERLGLAEALRSARQAHREAAEAAVESFRRRARGLRLALGLRMLNNYEADQLAYGGMGDLMAFEELGFDITLLVQGPPEAAGRFALMLETLGCKLPMQVFSSPWSLAPLLAEGGFEVAYLADHAAEEARKAKVPMMVSRSLEPFFSGVAPNLERLGELLGLAGRGEGAP